MGESEVEFHGLDFDICFFVFLDFRFGTCKSVFDFLDSFGSFTAGMSIPRLFDVELVFLMWLYVRWFPFCFVLIIQLPDGLGEKRYTHREP